MSATVSPEKTSVTRHVDPANAEQQYRSVSKAAIASVVFGVFSLMAFMSVPLLVFSLISISCGLIAFSNLSRFPDELLGKKASRIGFGLGLFSFVGAIAMHSYIYATEVPEGYERISFRMLRDDSKTSLPYSEKAEELDGKKVFVRGYVRPGAKRRNLSEFIMVGNFGDCCFGGTEKITDVIGVKIVNDETVDYSLRLRRFAGTFRLNRKSTSTSDKEVPKVFYQMEVDYLR